ncbi:MAG: hypothetical protein ACOY0T_17400 [Myxococcota bacterium]
MIELRDIELSLLANLDDVTGFAKSVDVLLAHLLDRGATGSPFRSTDGVLLEYFRADGHAILGCGVAILIDQSVHPVQLELSIDVYQHAVLAGTVHFGDSSRSIAYGSREHQNLTKQIVADPHRTFEWSHSWNRTGKGWSPMGTAAI